MSFTGILNRLGYVIIQRHNAVLSCLSTKQLSNKPPEPIVLEGIPASAATQKKTKRPIVPKITLISGKDDISVVTLEDAQKIATRRNLKLVKIVDLDTKTERPVFQLMTAADYAAEDAKTKKEKKSGSGFKGDKLLMLSSAISDHDLETQIKKIEKWIGKDYEVRVTITANSNNTGKSVSVFCGVYNAVFM